MKARADALRPASFWATVEMAGLLGLASSCLRLSWKVTGCTITEVIGPAGPDARIVSKVGVPGSAGGVRGTL